MNQRTHLKICGITRLEDARFAAGAMADYLGFVFYPGSPRHVTARTAAEIIGWIEGPEKVGVFVNQPAEEVNGIIERTGIDFVQLHGDETPEYARQIRKPVIKAFRVKESDDLDTLLKKTEPWKGVATFFMFDAWHDNKYGGTGQAWDWSRLSALSKVTPFFLAGGISAHNVEDAVSGASPYAVDLSSSIESAPGVKDFEKMQAFFDRWNEVSEH